MLHTDISCICHLISYYLCHWECHWIKHLTPLCVDLPIILQDKQKTVVVAFGSLVFCFDCVALHLWSVTFCGHYKHASARARAHTHTPTPTHTHTHTVRLLPSHRSLPVTKKHNIIPPRERRNSNPQSQQASTSGPRLRQCGHRDRLIQNIRPLNVGLG